MFQSDRSVNAATNFTFNGSMSKEVLRNYASRAVTSWIVLEGNDLDPIFEEDLRMTLRIGAKYLGRAASFSWSGNWSATQINEHFRLAKERAAIIHKADPEIILQGGVFEIVYKNTVNNTVIPAWVFEDFGLPVEKRNFRYTDVAFPAGHEYGPGFWGNGPDAAIPKIANVEAQMYFYYNICRYIDAGFEAIHLGQTEKMMYYQNENNAVEWDRVTTLGRAYAKKHARRGVVLFDGHSNLDSPGIKVGNRLILDIQAAALVPNETRKLNGAMECEISHFSDNWLQWIGRTGGGMHPLGFQIDTNFTILEFDNYGGNGKPGVATPQAFYVWGYDDITWFALQPEWYRNQFLLECDAFLKTNVLDSTGKQVYFLQPCLRRVLTSNQTMDYKPGSSFNVDFVLDYLGTEKTKYTYDEATKIFSLTVTKDYRANRQSDGCPNGSSQENTIREIFLGKNAPENPELLKIVLPPAYAAVPSSSESSSSSSSSKISSSSTVSAGSKNDSSADDSVAGSAISTDSEASADSAIESADVSDVSAQSVESSVSESIADSSASEADKGGSMPGWVFGVIAGIVALCGAAIAGYFLFFKKRTV
ncbi:MAG: hypothetical protein ACYCYM_01790 [Saccharofermentanales bacterium]